MIKFIIMFFMSTSVYASPIKVVLSDWDQDQLTQAFSKIDARYRTEELIEDGSITLNRKTYTFLGSQYGLSIQCSEDFVLSSVVSQNRRCDVIFNEELSKKDILEVHDGFMPDFVIAEVKDAMLANILYSAISNGLNSPSVFFNTKERLFFTHPQTGKQFPSWRLRIDCKRDAGFRDYSCVVGAVK